MIDEKTYNELLQLANLAEEKELSQAADWLHKLVVGAHETPTLAIFEANIDCEMLELQCLSTHGIFIPCFSFELKHALDGHYRFPPLFRVMQAGHKFKS